MKNDKEVNVFYIRESLRYEIDRNEKMKAYEPEIEEQRKEYETSVMAVVLHHIHQAFYCLDDLLKSPATLEIKEILLNAFDKGDMYMKERDL